MNEQIKDFFSFMKKATTPVQTVEEVSKRLLADGFKELDLKNPWTLEEGGKYYVSPFSTMLVAFTMGSRFMNEGGFHIIGAHTDNPSFRVKNNPQLVGENMVTLNIEKYGGPILNTWFDRPLSLAGQIAVRSQDPLNPKIIKVDFARPIITIPNLAIHMNRAVNEGATIDIQKEMRPILTQVINKELPGEVLKGLVAKETGVDKEDILDIDLYVYCAEEGCLVGAEEEFISCPRIDDLAMVYAASEAIRKKTNRKGINMAAFFDNEEVGSFSKQGADSQMLQMITERIRLAIDQEEEPFLRRMMDSFILSADGAHAYHPNYQDKNDVTNHPVMNGGMTIKVSRTAAYASEIEASAGLQQLFEREKIPYQKFHNHSNIRGGKTIGPIISSHFPVHTIDLGVPMLAMHSTREMMGKEDLLDAVRIFEAFYGLYSESE